MEVAGPLGTPLGLAQLKRASPRGEAGTSGFLSVSDCDRRVPAGLGQESQASSRGEAKDSALLSPAQCSSAVPRGSLVPSSNLISLGGGGGARGDEKLESEPVGLKEWS